MKLFDAEPLITTKKIAKQLGLSEKTIRKWRYHDIIPAECYLKLGRSIRYRPDEFLKWIQTRQDNV